MSGENGDLTDYTSPEYQAAMADLAEKYQKQEQVFYSERRRFFASATWLGQHGSLQELRQMRDFLCREIVKHQQEPNLKR